MVKCSSCGAGMRFDPASGRLKCDYCDNSMEIVNQTADNISKESDGGEQYETKLFTCPNCGGEILSDTDTAVTFCNYCGSSVELEGRLVTMTAPTVVIPFKKTREEVKEAYLKHTKKALYVPGYMKEEGKLEKLRGIYMPYWLYDFDAKGPASFNGQKSHRSGDYIITDHYKLTSDFDANYAGTSFDASSNFSDELSQSIAPFEVKDSVGFNDAYMSGFYADAADVKPEVYEEEARSVVSEEISRNIINTPEYKGYGVSTGDGNVPSTMNMRKKTLAYFPVWFLANRHGDHVSYAVINGQTGKIAADLPIAYMKYIISSILLAIPIALLLNWTTVVITPKLLSWMSIIFAIISMIIISKEKDLLYTRSQLLDDMGLRSVRGVDTDALISDAGSGKVRVNINGKRKNINKQPFKEKSGVMVKPIIAIALSLLVIAFEAVNDLYYYIAVTAGIVLVALSFIDVVRLHNKLTKRVPRQFNVRGGDEGNVNNNN